MSCSMCGERTNTGDLCSSCENYLEEKSYYDYLEEQLYERQAEEEYQQYWERLDVRGTE